MAVYEYKVVPAPSKGVKAPGVKGPEARFAYGLEQAMNGLAADGWEYLRADILPSEERQGLTSSHTVYRSVLVFRRAVDPDATPEHPPAAPPAEADPLQTDATDEATLSQPIAEPMPDTQPESDPYNR
jgi:hypothetical protein